MDFANDIPWGNSISLTSHLGGRGYGETIQLGGGGADHVGSCTSVQGELHWVFVIEGCYGQVIGQCSHEGLLALHSGLVGLQGHRSHPRAGTPQDRGRQGHSSPCVTEPIVDGHGLVGSDNPSGCEWYVGDQQFCRGCKTRRGVVRVGLEQH